VRAVRARQQRNFLATLLLSQGVPMLQAGDEISRTQHGNNNAYCQDNEVSWLVWSAEGPLPSYVDLVAQLVELRRQHPVFRQRAFFAGHEIGDGTKDLAWFTAGGDEMNDDDWTSPTASTHGKYLSGRGIRTRGPRGERIVDDSFLVVLHAGAEASSFRLPGPPWADAYVVELDTADTAAAGRDVKTDELLTLTPRSLVLLRVV
jgi:glycogen operon protein